MATTTEFISLLTSDLILNISEGVTVCWKGFVLEKVLTALDDVVAWRLLICSSRNAAHLAFAFLVLLAGVLLSGTKAKLHLSSKGLSKHVLGKKMCEAKKIRNMLLHHMAEK